MRRPLLVLASASSLFLAVVVLMAGTAAAQSRRAADGPLGHIAAHGLDRAAQAASWRLTPLTPADRGVTGARWPAASAAAGTLAFVHDGDLASAGGPGNPDGNPEIWSVSGGALNQITATSRSDGRTPAQSVPSLARDGDRLAFLSDADLTGANPDRSNEVWVWEQGAVTAVDAAITGAAEAPMLSANGEWVTYWHDGDLTGDNPDGSLELFLTRVGGATAQLTDLRSSPYHDAPAISADGGAIAFIIDADLTGDNADGSWELFMWEGPASTPGDPARFRQITRWAPPMTGREIYHPSLSGDGTRVAFAGRGHVDERLSETHTEIEIYLWSRPDTLRRLTRATVQNASSLLPRISDDGRAISMVSLSDLAPGAPGNPERNQDLFVWSECTGFSQATSGTGRGGILANVIELRPGLDGAGGTALFVSERDDDMHPLALPSRRGIAVSAVDEAGVPCAPTPVPATPTVTASPTSRPATNTPTASPTPPAATPTNAAGTPTPPRPGQVCPQMAGRIPSAVQAQALLDPASVYGWTLPANPGLPPGYGNPPRRWLSLRDPGKPYGPANPPVWKVGCP